MKKVIVLLFCLFFTFSLCACDLNLAVNKINDNQESTKTQQEKEKHTKLADGTYLFEKSGVFSEKKIHFRDEENNILLDSSDILFVSAKWSEYNGYYIQLEFTEEGTAKFANATRVSIGKEIRIVLDEQILTSAVVNTEITDGIAIIANYESYDDLISLFNTLVK